MRRLSKQATRCPRCRLHLERCACADIPRIELETHVALVMHYREAVKGSATGPLALACLTNCSRHLHGLAGAPLDLTPLHENGRRRVLVLFPAEGARPLSRALTQEDARPITLVVPDGNWHQARRIPRRVRGLETAECVRLPPGPPSAWGVRREPSAHCVSTFEAVARALGELEDLEARSSMETVFTRIARGTLESRGEADRAAVSSAAAPARPVPAATSGEPEALEVVYRDAHLVAINKPAGLPSHHGWARDVRPALQRVRDQIGQTVYLVHRLDRATSGLLLFALSPELARDMQPALAAGDKRYLALCRGHDQELIRVDHPLAKEPGAERRQAVTEFRWLGSFERYGLYEALPRTGRTHQIRRHLKHVSQPIVGDVRYGKGDHNRLFRERFGFHRLALHCRRLAFVHPRGGHTVELTAPLDPAFTRLLAAIGLLNALPGGA